MIAELGLFSVLIAVALAFMQGLLPLVGARCRWPVWMRSADGLARGQCAFLGLALALLAVAFYSNDFSVRYVAENSNTALPFFYRLAAVWGGHEGSLLLWVFMLSLWTAAITFFGRSMPLLMRAQIIGVLGWVSVGFLLFLILTSNPFDRLLPAVAEGRDLNPLLQDPGLIIHPPILYMGYVGFSVIFAFAIAALLTGRMDSAWTRWARPWALAAWCFLTLGIVLGSWWAYYELGWGGWWFWDPVENASFIPWIVGTALLHSLAATEARGLFKPWTALLAIMTFALCLLGTFLVRSGVLTSVHAFATDPQRGLFILLLLFVTVASSLVLYAWRAPTLAGSGRFALLSRESGILINNLLLTAAAFCVLLGTLYPLILDALGVGKISVGPPYFNLVFAPLAGISAMLAAVGALCRWKADSFVRLVKKLGLPLLATVAATAVVATRFDDGHSVAALLGLALAFWILFATARVAFDRLRAGGGAGGGFWGMVIAHAGIGLFVAGVTVVQTHEQQADVWLRQGEPVALGRYDFELLDVREARVDNYDATIGAVRVVDSGREVAVVEPEKRRYFAQPDNPMTEAGIAVGWHGDWYVSLGDPLDGGGWSARVQYKPLVRFIWGGAVLMALGGMVAAADRRYRRRRRRV